MPEALVILQPSLSADERAAITRVAPVRQAISDRVFLADVAGAGLDALRATPGIARIVTGGEPVDTLPEMTDAERLFGRAWLSARGGGDRDQGQRSTVRQGRRCTPSRRHPRASRRGRGSRHGPTGERRDRAADG